MSTLPRQVLFVLTLRYRPNEKVFTVARQNVRLSVKAQVGDVVTFSCDSYSARGTPVNPHIFRVRFDLSWLDLVSGASNVSKISSKGNALFSWWTLLQFYSAVWCIKEHSPLGFGQEKESEAIFRRICHRAKVRSSPA